MGAPPRSDRIDDRAGRGATNATPRRSRPRPAALVDRTAREPPVGDRSIDRRPLSASDPSHDRQSASVARRARRYWPRPAQDRGQGRGRGRGSVTPAGRGPAPAVPAGQIGDPASVDRPAAAVSASRVTSDVGSQSRPGARPSAVAVELVDRAVDRSRTRSRRGPTRVAAPARIALEDASRREDLAVVGPDEQPLTVASMASARPGQLERRDGPRVTRS